MHWRIRAIIEETSDATYYGAACRDGLRRGWHVDSIVMYARMAWRHALLAMQIGEQQWP